jgi:hypothetical protein
MTAIPTVLVKGGPNYCFWASEQLAAASKCKLYNSHLNIQEVFAAVVPSGIGHSKLATESESALKVLVISD